MTEDLTRYVDDPVGFVNDVLGEAGMPYSKQVEMLEAVVEHRRVSVVGANGCGKDWAAARAVLWWIETRPQSKVVVTGPTQRQVEEIVWQEMREAFAVAEERLGGKMLASKYRIDEKRFAIGFSTNKACNIQGFHSPNLLVVVTEAHAMPQDQIDSIKRLHPNRLLLVGNAMTLEGEFYESHHSRRARYHRIKISAYDTPNFTGEMGGVPGMITPEDAEELALDWSEDHPSYVAGVLAEFPNAQEDSLVGRDAVEHAMDPGSVVPAEAGTSQPGAHGGGMTGGEIPAFAGMTNEPVYLGVDVGRFGADKSAICVRQGQRVHSLRSFSRMDTMRLVYEIIRTREETGAEAIFVDEGGLGGGVIDRLRELGEPVYGVHFGGRAPHRTRFFNTRSEIFWEVRMLLNDGLMVLPPDEELAGQLVSLRYDVSSSGQVRLEGKREMRKRGLPSPDKADALALAFLKPPSFGIWTGTEPFLDDDLPLSRRLPRPQYGIGYELPRPSLSGPPEPGAGPGSAPPADASGDSSSPPVPRIQVWW